ncbi:MAG TPA: serine/threonine-protein kinase [Myxococcota bacterium]|nr:serine/threonine-protein kinase [Myxococcota bacterium]HRY92256.1 serine/threonine-protein kinase [Myxococcota bacterium]HSA22736.1 serine/threonine-protein kinase [Myxococcota bacterium]
MQKREGPAAPGAEDLLLGVLAVQLGFLTSGQVIEVAAAWATDPRQGLGARLRVHPALDAEKLALLEAVVARAISAHGGDAHQTLEELGGAEAVGRSFGHSLVLSGADAGVPPSAPSGAGELGVGAEQPGRYARRGGEAADSGEIGRGAIGRVLLVFDEFIGREVAMKELLAGAVAARPASPTPASFAVARFLREARVTGQLEHPNIVPVYEIGQRTDGTLYYTMKVVRGRTLGAAIAQARGLPGRLALLGHFADLCQAIAYAHSRGVVHRDIKPDNTMVGEFGETVVLDWGLAKAKGEADLRGSELQRRIELIQDARASATMEGVALGTPCYMSPEQAEGRLEDVDERSDVWSLGAVLYEMLTGRPPFQGVTAYEVIGKVIARPITPVRALCPQAPAELASVAEKALCRPPERRYQGARELADEVTAFLTGGRVQAYDYRAWELLRRFARRNWTAVATAAVALVLLLSLGVGAYLKVARERNAALAAEQAERGGRAALLAEGARHDLTRGAPFEARAKLRSSLELRDSILGRALWSELDREPLSWLHELHYPVYGAAFSPDSRRLALAPQEGQIRLVDLATMDVSTLGLTTTSAQRLAWTADGARLVTCCADRGAQVWDVQAGRVVLELPTRVTGVYGLAIVPGTGRVVLGGRAGQVEVWDMATATRVAALPGHTARVYGLDASPDGAWIATGAEDGRILVHAAATGEPGPILTGHTGNVTALAFSPDGRLLASASTDRTVRLWDVPAFTPRAVLAGHSGRLYAIAFHPGGRLLATAGADQRVYVWDVPGDAPRAILPGSTDRIFALAFSPDGRWLASGDLDHQARLWDVPRVLRMRPEVERIEVEFASVVSPDDRTLATIGRGDYLKLFDMESGRLLRRLEGHKGSIQTVDFHPSSARLATGGWDTTIRIWELSSGAQVLVLAGHTLFIHSLRWGRDGQSLVTLGGDRSLRRWDLERGVTRWVADTGGGSPHMLAWAERLVVTLDVEGRFRTWDADTGQARSSWRCDPPGPPRMALDPSGRTMAYACPLGALRLRDLASGRERIIGPPAESWNPISFDPPGQRLFARRSGQGGVYDLARATWQTREGWWLMCPDWSCALGNSLHGSLVRWDIERERPAWGAPALVPADEGPPRVKTQRGWLRMTEPAEPAEPPDAAWRDALEQASLARFSADGRTLCVSLWPDRLQVWDRDGEAPLREERLPRALDLVALPGGCASLGVEVATAEPRLDAAVKRGQLTWVPRAGPARILHPDASALGAAGRLLLAATPGRVWLHDTLAGTARSVEASGDVSAVDLDGDDLLLGSLDGVLTRLDLAGGADKLVYQATPPCPVLRVATGAPGVVLAGYSDGTVGLWDRTSGFRLDAREMNGPVNHLWVEGARAYLATERGDTLAWDLGVLERPYCDLLREVWSRVPVIWEGGEAREQRPDPGHPCGGP